jgi:hypothetical protein
MIIFIAGMHRSGSSVISRAMTIMGINHTNHLMPAHEDNKKGYWEDEEFIEFNDNLLAKTGQTWYEPKATNHEEIEWWASELNKEALSLLRKKISNKDHICLKDPRLCNLIPFWKKICDDNKIKMRLIASYRHPIENANSIYKRDKININQGLLLWSAHYINLLSSTSGDQIYFIKYNDILSNPANQIQKISKFLNQPIIIDELNKFKIEFLDHSLRHNTETVDELLVDKEIINLCLDLCRHIEAIKCHIPSKPTPQELIAESRIFSQRLLNIDSNFSSISRYQKIITDLIQTRHDIHTLHSHINTQSKELQQAKVDIQLTRKHVDEIHRQHEATKIELLTTRRLRQESRQRYNSLLDQIEIMTNTLWWKLSYPIRFIFSSRLSKKNLNYLKKRFKKKTKPVHATSHDAN